MEGVSSHGKKRKRGVVVEDTILPKDDIFKFSKKKRKEPLDNNNEANVRKNIGSDKNDISEAKI